MTTKRTKIVSGDVSEQLSNPVASKSFFMYVIGRPARRLVTLSERMSLEQEVISGPLEVCSLGR